MVTEDKDMVYTNEQCLHHKDDCIWSEEQETFILNDDVRTVYGGGIVAECYRDSNYLLCEDTNEYHLTDETWYDEVAQVYYSDNASSTESFCGNYEAHEDSFADDHDWVWVERGIAEDHWVHQDDVYRCSDIDEYVHADDANYCEVDEEHYYDCFDLQLLLKVVLDKFVSCNLSWEYGSSDFYDKLAPVCFPSTNHEHHNAS